MCHVTCGATVSTAEGEGRRLVIVSDTVLVGVSSRRVSSTLGSRDKRQMKGLGGTVGGLSTRRHTLVSLFCGRRGAVNRVTLVLKLARDGTGMGLRQVEGGLCVLVARTR